MGTGLNIGGAFGMGVDSSDDSGSSDGFEDSGSFNVRSSQDFQGRRGRRVQTRAGVCETRAFCRGRER